MYNKTIKILVGDNTAEYGVKTASHLKSAGFFAYTRANDYDQLVSAMLNDAPDIAIVDLSVGKSDALLLIRELKSRMKKAPVFIIASDFDNNFIRRQVMESGASYLITKPIDCEELISEIRVISQSDNELEPGNVEIAVTEFIREIGNPANVKGYNYLRTAIINSLFDRTLTDSFSKLLYPSIATEYQSTPARVERAIRHAIDIAWERGKNESLTRYFGTEESRTHSKPSNSEFISLFTDVLRLKLKCSRRKVYCT